jgi:D-alanine-D-alanine ligase
MRVVLLVDEATFSVRDRDFARQQPRYRYQLAEYSVADALRALRHQVFGVPATADVVDTVSRIVAHRPDCVFNLVEQIDGMREHDSLFVQVLEVLGIPYTGASADTLRLARNKHLAKLTVALAGVDVPSGLVLHRGRIGPLAGLRFPAIIKPLHGDGSDGIDERSLVKDAGALRRQFARMSAFAPLLCEEYVPGRELILTMSGTRDVTVDSICELVFPEGAAVAFATPSAKFNARYRERCGIHYRTPTTLDARLHARVVAAAKSAYRALRINAYAKLEFRVDGDRAVFIEANPNSQMNRTANSTDFKSIGYERFVRKILKMAMERAGR